MRPNVAVIEAAWPATTGVPLMVVGGALCLGATWGRAWARSSKNNYSHISS